MNPATIRVRFGLLLCIGGAFVDSARAQTAAGPDAGAVPAAEEATATDAAAPAPVADRDDAVGWDEPATAGVQAEGGGVPDDDATVSAASAAEPPAEVRAVGAETTSSEFAIEGTLRSTQALWVERLTETPLGQARQALGMTVRYRRQWLRSGDPIGLLLIGGIQAEYDLATRPGYSVEQETREIQDLRRETFAALSIGPWQLAFGRQIVSWGQGQVLSAVDLVNPRDQREPGLAELEDLRMPVLSTRAGFDLQDVRMEAVVVHESFFGLRPPPLSDWSPVRPELAEEELLWGKRLDYAHTPAGYFGPQQFFARLGYRGHGIDLDLYGASALDRQGVVDDLILADLTSPDVVLRVRHPRYEMVGHSGALPLGPFVVRWEAALELGRPELTARDEQADAEPEAGAEENRLIGLLGLSYQCADECRLGAEYIQSGRVLGAPELRRPSLALVWNQSALDQRLQWRVIAIVLGPSQYAGWFAKATLDYELLEGFRLGVGFATFQPAGDDETPISAFVRHDRALLFVRWDFFLL